ncbi:juvenile hormone epoxide hydrolase 2-like [Anthonomus grandis grandis]|uniref:juvenile hormone epoxide hydrolase 2-like n=1 Tax=Anthonomus grandis grandis TaxID=2921223 RepID=UPI002166693C|nr:juvenile hormone epoxide hydrolase 2-like [Anthonomus grandis grandis]
MKSSKFLLAENDTRTFYRKLTSSLTFDKNRYWGPGERAANPDNAVRKFTIDIPTKDQEDLKWRLEHVRPLAPPLEGVQQQYGMNTNLLKEILEFWRIQYSWTERQQYLNQYPQFKTNIQGLDIHFLHVKPENPGNKKVLPLLIVHGWPGSVREFYDVIRILTKVSDDRDFVFEVVAPHIPGFGFSQKAAKPGLGSNQVAVIMSNLMERLGHKKFYCQGGDFGAIILQGLAVLYPEKVLGYHTNMAYVSTPWAYIKTFLGQLYPSWVVKPEHQHRVYPLWRKLEGRIRETGYLHLQATKPDTLGVAMTDSPAGLAAYILEKFTSGTNIAYQRREDGGLLERFTYTDLLDNVMLYWWTSSATTSFRLYAETFSKRHSEEKVLQRPLKVPTAIARFAHDFYVADGLLGDIYRNNLQLNDLDGGHFAAFEVPEVFTRDVFSAVEKFEEYHKKRT